MKCLLIVKSFDDLLMIFFTKWVTDTTSPLLISILQDFDDSIHWALLTANPRLEQMQYK